jgi:hypothetical protein
MWLYNIGHYVIKECNIEYSETNYTCIFTRRLLKESVT